MRRTSTLLLLVVVGWFAVIRAQAPPPAPKPDPAVSRLAAMLGGRWTYVGEYKAGPLGPGGKITGVYTGQAILNGFFFEGRETETGAAGVTQILEIDVYDPANKNFVSTLLQDDGSRFSGTVTVAGNTITWEGKFIAGGQQFLLREPFVLSADLKSGTGKADISTDGKTWTPFFEAKFTKAPPAATK